MAKQRKTFGQKRENSKKQIFVGRENQIQSFQQNIQIDPYEDDFLNIFNLFGQGGVGKTTLLGKFLSICKSANYSSVLTDTEDVNIFDVTETMNFIAEALEKQDLTFKRFAKRHKEYLQAKGKLQAAPDKPKGTWGKIVKTGIKIGSKIGAETLPGVKLILDPLTDPAAEIAGEWIDFVEKTMGGKKDDVDLVMNPLKELTPLWIEDLFDASEKKKIALFFDTFEESNPQLQNWLLDLFKLKYGDIPSILIVIGGRYPLDSERWSEFSSDMHKIKLEPFTEQEAKNYLAQKGVNNSELIEQLLSISGHLPVYLSLLTEGDLTGTDVLFDPKERVVARFLRNIDNSVHRDLALHACLPSQLNQDVVECLLPDSEKASAQIYFEWLKNRPFVERRNNYWAYHAVVREIMQRHFKEISEKEWEIHHTILADWYESKSAKFKASDNSDNWFEDENWRINVFEKHFHLLSSNYKKHLTIVVQDFVSLLLNLDYGESIPLITVLISVEKIMDVQKGLGEILQKGVGGLMSEQEEGVLPMFRDINQMDCIIKEDEKSFMLYGQGIFEPNSEQKIACYQKALEIKPDKHAALYNMGNAYYNKRDYDQAIACYQKALEIKPDKYQALYNMGLAYDNKGNYDQAIACYQKALEIKPDDHEALYNMGLAYYNKRDYDQAIAFYQKALEIKPDYHEAFNNMGLAYDNKGDYDQAIAFYQKALEIKPDKHEALYIMGNAYANKRDYDQAIACYQKALEIKPYKHEALYNMGLAYDNKGDYDQAIACYQKALDIKPDDHEAFYNMGLAYDKKGDYDHAIECYQKVVDIKPDDHEALHSIGWSNLLKWNFDIAKSYLQRVWELSNFAHSYAAMNLGHVSLLHELDREVAILWYKKSIILREDSNNFFEGMESDFLDLQMEKQGITREDFDQIINELKM